AKGLGVNAASEVDFTLNGNFTNFVSDIGVDDEVGSNGSVDFQVFLDNSVVPAFDSGLMTRNSATQTISPNVSDKTLLLLVVTNGGNGNAFDHADWAGAQVVPTAAATPPKAPDGLMAAYDQVQPNQVDLQWNDNAGDEAGYRVERKAGINGV